MAITMGRKGFQIQETTLLPRPLLHGFLERFLISTGHAFPIWGCTLSIERFVRAAGMNRALDPLQLVVVSAVARPCRDVERPARHGFDDFDAAVGERLGR